MEREKNLLPNLDWPAGRLYHALGLEVPLYTPIFVMSRVTGWSAHIIEQLDYAPVTRVYLQTKKRLWEDAGTNGGTQTPPPAAAPSGTSPAS